MFTITIKKEVQVRHCRIVRCADGTAEITAYADGVAYITDWALSSLDHARQHCETVQLGGCVHWSLEGTAESGVWTSDRVLCENGGTRLTPAECELARKALARKERTK